MLIKLYSRLTATTGGEDDDGGYGVFDGACASSVLLFCVLAASVIIWKACAFVAMAAVLLGLGWNVFLPCCAAGGGRRRAGTDLAPAGLTATAIDALPASAYEGSAAVCSVCLEDVQGGETVRRLPECKHLYHALCIDAWLHWNTTCPLCRSDLSPRRRGAVREGSSSRIVG